MRIPYSINIILCLIAFAIAMYEFRRANPENRIFNPYFGLAAGAILMAGVNNFLRNPAFSPWLFLLALGWCVLAVYQLRTLPEQD
jgi:uncharacterized protein (DUF486 family)